VSSSEPFLAARFRVEIEGLESTGVVEVIFPEGRIIAGRGKSRVHYGPLTLRRGMTASGEWYRWWDGARRSVPAARKRVSVVLMDRFQADVNRWTFSGALPSAYAASPLNALRGELLIETLELAVRGFSIGFGADERAVKEHGLR
jgi:T4-like virus tail tube protein gp19